MSMATNHQLERLFYPRNIAMVGATPRRIKTWNSGNSFISASISQDFQGNIYPVHPKAETILGYRSYRNIRDIPGDIDLAIFTVPAPIALQVMADCVEKGVKFVHLLTAGFSETGNPEDAELEKQLVDIAKKGGIRMVGPNCMGLYCPEGGIAWNDHMPKKSGSIGFFSQSGQLAGHFVEDGSKEGLYYSKAVSFGNASDLQAHDFLEYLAQDDKTEVIGAYLEGLKDGRAFFEAAKKVTRKKPLVVWKGGQTAGGSRATQSHTAAIAGAPAIWDALCRQTGIIQVHSMAEAVFTISALQRTPLPVSTNVAIMGGAGGGSVTMTDLAEKAGLSVPHLSDETVRSLGEFVPVQGNSVRNPLDVFLDRDEDYIRLVKLLRDDANIDSLILSFYVRWVYEDGGRKAVLSQIERTINTKNELKKPIFVVLEKESHLELDAIKKEMAEVLHDNNIATFQSLEIAVRVLKNLNRYHDFLAASN
ncbi:MAG: acetyl-CoA synthetase [Proteobacteria bacterium]|nr:acetyl-CoA synthetase [Pseudomonadota bacterium]